MSRNLIETMEKLLQPPRSTGTAAGHPEDAAIPAQRAAPSYWAPHRGDKAFTSLSNSGIACSAVLEPVTSPSV